MMKNEGQDSLEMHNTCMISALRDDAKMKVRIVLEMQNTCMLSALRDDAKMKNTCMLSAPNLDSAPLAPVFHEDLEVLHHPAIEALRDHGEMQ
eukprot:660372-Lingulodinium_polyedra.AAC.1